ncbi:MAG: PAS domain-containing sensor histidine kinase [Candidatus Rokuibacteriota bacterium]|nr:MAG: PAS domain-containing sensor histidine kinase [Candidatus Rokubacteria bacterium]
MIRGLIRAFQRSIAAKLALTLVGFVAVCLLVASVYLNRALERLALESVEARLTTAARLLHDEARDLIQNRATPRTVYAFTLRAAGQSDLRVTVIGADGTVLGDSRVPPAELRRVENHAERPEVRAALAGRVGHGLRTSVTVGAPLFYAAVPVRDGDRVVGVLRMAVPLSVVTSSHAELHQVLLLGGLVALLAALGIAMFVAGRLTRPVVEMESVARRMSEGDFAVHAPVRSPDEIGVLGRALNGLAARLREKVRDLEEEQAKARAILESMVEGVVAVDGHDHIVVMNEGARTIFALGAARAEGKSFLEVIRNVDLYRIFRESRVGTPAAVVGRQLRLSTPVERVLEVHAAPLRLAGDEVGAVMVLHDVTELRRLEQVRTEFVANVSHELRTPLTAIHGYLETLLGGALEEPEHARKFLEIAFRHTERLGRLVSDLTDLSNIELGKVSLRLEATPLDEVVDSVLTMIRPRAAGGEVALSVDLPADLPPVRADRDRLAQILINLVDNGVKYTPAGGRVAVSARRVGPALVEVGVTDTGVGIPPADLPRVTERFYRVDRARSRELGGTGLGLAIVKHLVLAHGGELAIESQPGRGTVVRFSLPAARPLG